VGYKYFLFAFLYAFRDSLGKIISLFMHRHLRKSCSFFVRRVRRAQHDWSIMTVRRNFVPVDSRDAACFSRTASASTRRLMGRGIDMPLSSTRRMTALGLHVSRKPSSRTGYDRWSSCDEPVSTILRLNDQCSVSCSRLFSFSFGCRLYYVYF